MEERGGDLRHVPGGCQVMVTLEGEIHLGLLRPVPRRQDVAIRGTRANPGWRGAPTLDPVGRLVVAGYRVTAEKNRAKNSRRYTFTLPRGSQIKASPPSLVFVETTLCETQGISDSSKHEK